MPASDLAQVAGVFVPANFATWKGFCRSNVASGAQTIQTDAEFYSLRDGTQVNPYSTTIPITIGSGANQETVTPSAVSVVTNVDGGSAVLVTATFSNAHSNGDPIVSGTGGVAEAQAAATAAGGASVVSGGNVTAPAATALTTNGAIPPHTTASYLITKAGVLADTLAAPTSGTDDGVTISVTSGTAFAHTITATGLLNTGSAAVNLATFAAFAGANVVLRALTGKWNVISSVGVTFS